ncbi:MAG: RNA polymerase subunit sigma-24 [Chloroflexi bacterium]|nr:RNA polymerase subunit sigma-24 [Chloroflexota bacterium]
MGRDLQIEEARVPDFAAVADDEIGDDLLGLIFAACYLALAIDARAALTLRVVGGLRTDEIARAFPVPEPTVAQRLVRARRTLRREQVRFEVPTGDDLRARLPAVLEVIYLIFNEGYAVTSGREWMRPQLCRDSLRLGRILVGLIPRVVEVHGLVALMETQASRERAQTGPDGAPILLGDQNRALWDPLLIRRGLAALHRAGALVESAGPYAPQAAIAACHARARTLDETDWTRIAALYGELGRLTPSPVIALNRAVAIARATGWEAGLATVDGLADDPTMRDYPAYHAARGDLLAHLGRYDEARQTLSRASALTRNDAERAALAARIADLTAVPKGAPIGSPTRPG